MIFLQGKEDPSSLPLNDKWIGVWLYKNVHNLHLQTSEHEADDSILSTDTTKKIFCPNPAVRFAQISLHRAPYT